MSAHALQSSCLQGLSRSMRKKTPAPARTTVLVQAKGGGKRKGGPAGFVAEDNSGRANIFAVEPKTLYTSSPTADRAAKEGLGGLQGLAVLGAALALVALTTLGVAKSPDQGGVGFAGEESLTSLAARVAASL